ncbi:MAG: hypothetical protein D6802_04050, partial [Ardenticatenia bacterium]
DPRIDLDRARNVELRAGQVSLHDANLVQAPEHPELVWTIWWYVWDTRGMPAGRYVLKARATDGEGNTQEGTRSGLFGDTFPDGTSLIHARAIFLDEA